jgi:hypothetical protein
MPIPSMQHFRSAILPRPNGNQLGIVENANDLLIDDQAPRHSVWAAGLPAKVEVPIGSTSGLPRGGRA